MAVIILEDGESSITVTKKGITIWLPFQVFGKEWKDLMGRLQEAIKQRPIHIFAPRMMSERDSDPDAPRWKERLLDALSWIVYLLKVPVGHELVKLWNVIPWSKINEIGGTEYKNAHSGSHAWAPAQVMAMLILMFGYGVMHETMIVALVQENIVWCWFCGFSYFAGFPAHDALYELRNRLGVVKFEELLTIVVQACLEAQLVSNLLANIDLTDVIASAHRWSPYERAVIVSRTMIRYLELVWAKQVPEEPFPEVLKKLAAEVALESLPHKSMKGVNPERVVKSVEKWEEEAEGSEPVWKVASDEIVEQLEAEEIAPDLQAVKSKSARIESLRQNLGEWLKGIAKKVIEKMPHARGDQNARVGRTTSYTWFCGYLMGFVVDSKHQVITAVVLAAGNIKQYKLFKPALKAHSGRLGNPQAMAADSAFDEFEVHHELDQEGITGHITSRDHAQPRDGGYGTDRVTWVERSDQPLCPGDAPLAAKTKSRDGRQVFEGTACKVCDSYSRCHPKGEGEPKQFSLNPQTHRRWQKNRSHCQTEEYKDAQARRFTSEGRFGLAKMNHRGARAPYRSDDMNLIAGLMIAIVMDLRILAQHQHIERGKT